MKTNIKVIGISAIADIIWIFVFGK